MPAPTPLHAARRALLDFAPLVAFFVGYKLHGLALATGLMVAATVVSLGIIYFVERRVALLPLISGTCVLVFGTLTLALNDELFIKLRPTIVNALFGSALLIGVYGYKQGWMKHLLSFAFQLTERGWLVLSRRWGWFFYAMALLNEAVWRSVPTDVWVNIKVFGYVGVTMAFTFAQFKLIERHALPDEPPAA